jgi:phosphoribosylformylglycinamidine synthase
MVFPNNNLGLTVDLTSIPEEDLIKILFSENPGVIVQTTANAGIEKVLEENQLIYYRIGTVLNERRFELKLANLKETLDINRLRDLWFKTSYLLDRKQCGEKLAKERYENYQLQELKFSFPESFQRHI